MNNINAFKINTFQELKTHLIICEDIFENPLQIRENALQKYNYSIRKAFGYVCKWGFLTFDMLKFYAETIKLNIYLKAFHYLFISNGISTFPHQDSNNISDIVRVDYENNDISNKKFISFASVIYLNPYIDKPNYTNFYEYFNNSCRHAVSAVTSAVGNRFNKCVIYDGSTFHSPGEGFGDDNDMDNPTDVRLTATYFIDAYHSTPTK
jgi:hypothetical protein